MDVYILYCENVDSFRTWLVNQYNLGNWHQYINYNSESGDLYFLNGNKVPTYYGIPKNTASLCILPVSDVWEIDSEGNPTDVPGGFIGASMGLLECIGEGVNRDPENDPFFNCWADPVNEAKYLLAFPRKPILDDEGNETGEYYPIAKFCEFDG